jgi:hypothetical protein
MRTADFVHFVCDNDVDTLQEEVLRGGDSTRDTVGHKLLRNVQLLGKIVPAMQDLSSTPHCASVNRGHSPSLVPLSPRPAAC